MLSYCEGDKCWHRLPRMVMKSPPSEMLKSYLDMVLGSLVKMALLELEVGPDDLQRSLPSQTFCHSEL